MATINNKMKLYMCSLLKKENTLDDNLNKLISYGLIYRHGCCFLKQFHDSRSHVKEEDFVDKTGMECFINSLYINDYAEDNFFINSLLFVDRLAEEWRKMRIDRHMKVIISESEDGVNLRFHIQRDNEYWLDENNLENFKEEGILVLKVNGCEV